MADETKIDIKLMSGMSDRELRSYLFNEKELSDCRAYLLFSEAPFGHRGSNINPEIYGNSPRELLDIVKSYCSVVERAFKVCGDDLLLCFYHNDSNDLNELLTDGFAQDTYALNGDGSGLYFQSDFVAQYVLTHKDEYPNFYDAICSVDNKVFESFENNSLDVFNQTDVYEDDDVIVFPNNDGDRKTIYSYINASSPLVFNVFSKHNDDDYAIIGVHTNLSGSDSLNNCFVRTKVISTETRSEKPSIQLIIIDFKTKKEKDAEFFVYKAIFAIVSMIRENMLVCSSNWLFYPSLGNGEFFLDNDNNVINYLQAYSVEDRVITCSIGSNIPETHLNIFDSALKKNGFTLSGKIPYISHDSDFDIDKVSYNYIYTTVLEIGDSSEDEDDSEYN